MRRPAGWPLRVVAGDQSSGFANIFIDQGHSQREQIALLVEQGSPTGQKITDSTSTEPVNHADTQSVEPRRPPWNLPNPATAQSLCILQRLFFMRILFFLNLEFWVFFTPGLNLSI